MTACSLERYPKLPSLLCAAFCQGIHQSIRNELEHFCAVSSSSWQSAKKTDFAHHHVFGGFWLLAIDNDIRLSQPGVAIFVLRTRVTTITSTITKNCITTTTTIITTTSIAIDRC